MSTRCRLNYTKAGPRQSRAQIVEFLNRASENATPAEITITADGASNSGVPISSRAVREKENECVIGIPKCSSFRDQIAQWESCGFQVGAMIEELVVHHEKVLNLVLDKLGDKTKSHMVPETLCAILRLRMKEDVGNWPRWQLWSKARKVRLIHDMRRNGANSKVTFQERLVLPRVKDIVRRVMELPENTEQRTCRVSYFGFPGRV